MVPSYVPRYTWLPPAERPPLYTKEVMVLPLFQNSLPLAASRANSTACDDRCARCAALIWLSLVCNSPLAAANTTPLTTIGVSGEAISRDTHPGCKTVAPFCSASFHAAIPPERGARIQRVPAE